MAMACFLLVTLPPLPPLPERSFPWFATPHGTFHALARCLAILCHRSPPGTDWPFSRACHCQQISKRERYTRKRVGAGREKVYWRTLAWPPRSFGKTVQSRDPVAQTFSSFHIFLYVLLSASQRRFQEQTESFFNLTTNLAIKLHPRLDLGWSSDFPTDSSHFTQPCDAGGVHWPP